MPCRRVSMFFLVAAMTVSYVHADDPTADAETIARVTNSLRLAKEELAGIDKDLTDPKSEFAIAEKEFQAADDELNRLKKMETSGEDFAVWEADVEKWTEVRKSALARFELAVAARKSKTAKKDALRKQIEQDQKLLDRLNGVTAAPQPTATNPPTSGEKAPPATTPTAPANPPPAVSPLPGLPVTPPTNGEAPPATQPEKKPEAAEVKVAREEAAAKRAEVEIAEQEAKSFEERVQVLQERIAAETQLLKTQRQQSDQALAEEMRLTGELAGAPDDRKQELLNQLGPAQKRVESTRLLVRETTDRLNTLNEELHHTREDQAAATKAAEEKREVADAADRRLSHLLDPFTPENLLKAGGEKLPKVLGILIGTILAYFVARQFTRQVVRFITRASNRGSEDDRENRANTLVGVFRYVANIVIVGGGAVLLLDELGVPLVPLMGGAAVLGLAVAFGAQNLIRDYFSGFMILTEDQYGINDVVKIGTVSGLVEKVTLRVTVLRDLEGVLHFIPNGGITNVSNMTHGWSRALFDVPCPHTEDVDRVMDVIRGLGVEMRADPVFGLKITADLEMLGVETIEANASMVRFLLKTRPLQQWSVKREMLRRIKRRFDELGIGIPANRVSVVVTDPTGRPMIAPEPAPRLLAS